MDNLNFLWSIGLDVLIVAIFALCIFIGVKKGFIRSVIWLVVLALAFFLSYKFTGQFADYLNDNFINQSVTDKLSEKVSAIFSGETGTEAVKISEGNAEIDENDMENNRSVLSDFLAKFSISFDEMKEWIREKKNSTVADISEFIAGSVSRSLSVGIAFVIIFVGTVVIGYIALWLISKLFETEPLSGVNKTLGGILGGIKGLALCLALCFALCRILPSLGSINGTDAAEIVEKTFIVKNLGRIFI